MSSKVLILYLFIVRFEIKFADDQIVLIIDE
jgi:hypothetical protein